MWRRSAACKRIEGQLRSGHRGISLAHASVLFHQSQILPPQRLQLVLQGKDRRLFLPVSTVSTAKATGAKDPAAPAEPRLVLERLLLRLGPLKLVLQALDLVL